MLAAPLLPNQIELQYLSPQLHPSLRIGDTVYNYGPGVVYKNSYAEEMANDDNWHFRNSTRVRLNLSPSEYSNLQAFLEGEIGKMYLWFPLPYYFTCVSATHRALSKTTSIDVPMGIDRSPALTEAYFAGRYLTGDSRVAGIYFYNRGGPLEPYIDYAIGLGDAGLEASFLWWNALASQTDRLPNSWRDTEVKAWFTGWFRGEAKAPQPKTP